MGAPKILLYGFGPYRRFRENITAQIIESLPKASHLRREIFAVRFDRRQFVEALRKHKPDVVLGLGQSSRQSIEIETRAINRRRAGKRSQARAIRKGGPRGLPTTLALKMGGRVRRSKNAGDYVCNFSMYVMLDEIRRRQTGTRFGFVHIPHHCDLRAAKRFAIRAIKQVRRSD